MKAGESCSVCGEPCVEDVSPGVWVHDVAELGDLAFDLNEDHVALPECVPSFLGSEVL